MFAMMASALGTGIFNLPLRVTEIGFIMFILYVVAAGAFSYLGCVLLQRMIVQKGFNSYGEICEKAFGPIMKRISQICLILFPWGITICYQVIMVKFIIQLLVDVLGCDLYSDRDMEEYNSTGSSSITQETS
jgi:amino acid permease